MTAREGSLNFRILEHMRKHPQAWRARELGDALKADVNLVSIALSQMFKDGGPLTRCEVELGGSQRKVFEYRIAANDGAAKVPFNPLTSVVGAPRRDASAKIVDSPKPASEPVPAKHEARGKRDRKQSAPADRPYRFAVFSDGGLIINVRAGSLELQPDEAAALHAFQSRIAKQ